MSKQRTSTNDINARERMNKALVLRKAGATLDQVATQCGYQSRSSAHKAIRRAMSELPKENAQELRSLEVARLDELLMSWWQRAKKDYQAAYLVLKIAERRSKLLGLDIDPQFAESRSVTVIREVDRNFLQLEPGELPDTNGHQEVSNAES